MSDKNTVSRTESGGKAVDYTVMIAENADPKIRRGAGGWWITFPGTPGVALHISAEQLDELQLDGSQDN